jgi:hypothetical protein
VLRAEAQVHGAHVREALDHQPGSGEQRAGQRHLQHDEQLADAADSEARAAAGLVLQDIVDIGA